MFDSYNNSYIRYIFFVNLLNSAASMLKCDKKFDIEFGCDNSNIFFSSYYNEYAIVKFRIGTLFDKS